MGNKRIEGPKPSERPRFRESIYKNINVSPKTVDRIIAIFALLLVMTIAYGVLTGSGA